MTVEHQASRCTPQWSKQVLELQQACSAAGKPFLEDLTAVAQVGPLLHILQPCGKTNLPAKLCMAIDTPCLGCRLLSHYMSSNNAKSCWV